MRIVFLGSGGYYANDRRHTAGILLPEAGVLLDAGTGLYRLPDWLRTPDLQIFLTHAHLDHIVGLTYLLVPMSIGQITTAGVYARPETLQAVRDHLFAPAVFPKEPDFDYIPLAPQVLVPDGGRLSHIVLTQHPGGSVGYRIDWDAGPGQAARSIAYITDTQADGSYTEFIRGVDLLIHECFFPDQSDELAATTGHSNTTAVARTARDADVGRLVLVHVDPRRTGDDPIGIDRARAVFPKTEIAEDLMEMTF